MSKANQLRVKLLKTTLELRAEDLESVGQKWRRERDPQEKNNLKRQLDDIELEMEEIEQELNERQSSRLTPGSQTLLSLLSANYDRPILGCIQKAYFACGLRTASADLESMLATLENAPPPVEFPYYSAIAQFTAYLSADPKLPEVASQELSNWANQAIGRFSMLARQVRQKLADIEADADAYLMVKIRRSDQDSTNDLNTADRYFVDAWFIPDKRVYSVESGDGCERIGLKETFDKTFAMAEVPALLGGFLDECAPHSNVDPTIEIFLPVDLLNEAVDRWLLEDELVAVKETIGYRYRIAVRSSERLRLRYSKRRVFWRKKWRILQENGQNSICAAFKSCDCDELADLLRNLESPEADNIIGLKFTIGSGKWEAQALFKLILQTAMPLGTCG